MAVILGRCEGVVIIELVAVILGRCEGVVIIELVAVILEINQFNGVNGCPSCLNPGVRTVSQYYPPSPY